MATAVSSSETVVNVNGSLAVTPDSRLEPARPSHQAPTSPSATPVRLSVSPSPIIIRKMSPACAPMAMRRPISCVRVAMEYWMSP